MMSVTELIGFSLSLPLVRIHRRLKLPRDGSVDRYDGLIRRFFPRVEPRARWLDVKLDAQLDTVVFSPGPLVRSLSLARHLDRCRRVSLMGVTIGAGVEEAMAEFQAQGRMLEAFVLDAMGSECAEAAAAFVADRIHETVTESGHDPTRRFSPGYGDLDLDIQRHIFTTLRLEEIGIHLNESLLMIPQKSVTAFIGWRQRESGKV